MVLPLKAQSLKGGTSRGGAAAGSPTRCSAFTLTLAAGGKPPPPSIATFRLTLMAYRGSGDRSSTAQGVEFSRNGQHRPQDVDKKILQQENEVGENGHETREQDQRRSREP